METATDAMRVVQHFLTRADITATRPQVGLMVKQVRTLFGKGYNSRDIIKVINYAVDVENVNMYSFGYVVYHVERILSKLKAEEAMQKIRDDVNAKKTAQGGATVDDESGKRNREKARRFSAESGFGKKYNFDMFEKS